MNLKETNKRDVYFVAMATTNKILSDISAINFFSVGNGSNNKNGDVWKSVREWCNRGEIVLLFAAFLNQARKGT